MPTPNMSAPSGNWPLLGRVTLQGVTKAATERTLESGPMVEHRSGMAVEATHHFLGSCQLSPLVGCDDGWDALGQIVMARPELERTNCSYGVGCILAAEGRVPIVGEGKE